MEESWAEGTTLPFPPARFEGQRTWEHVGFFDMRALGILEAEGVFFFLKKRKTSVMNPQVPITQL